MVKTDDIPELKKAVMTIQRMSAEKTVNLRRKKIK